MSDMTAGGVDPGRSAATRPGPAALARGAFRTARSGVGAAGARLRAAAGRPTRFAGAWPTREAALGSLPEAARGGYDTEGVAEVSLAAMSRVAEWDYPVIFWLERLMRQGARLLDAGGHLGTKYIAFSRLLPLDEIEWTVTDVPAILAAARAAQAAGDLPGALRFVDGPEDAAGADILLASGLLQYLDVPLADYVSRMPAPPRHILLNKVATRDGPEVVTLERIGPARVPYRIRSRAAFEAEVAGMGYTVRDSWDIRALSHVIPTHPWLGQSQSRGYLLERD
ncbi:MAG: methyltransferase, TIGR04325 family [Paracoccaceae bacterium]